MYILFIKNGVNKNQCNILERILVMAPIMPLEAVGAEFCSMEAARPTEQRSLRIQDTAESGTALEVEVVALTRQPYGDRSNWEAMGRMTLYISNDAQIRTQHKLIQKRILFT